MKNDNHVQKLYASRASLYERLFVDFLGWGKQLGTFFQESDYLHPNSKVLDVGCGTGIITRVLYQLAHENGLGGVTFHAFDLTQDMLTVFQQWITAHAAPHIELRQADVLEIEKLPSHWRDYNLIVTSTMLEYLPRDKVQAALANLKQMLAEDGILLVFITKHQFVTQWLAAKWWKTTLYSEPEIQMCLHEAGFDKIQFKSFSSRWSKYIMVVEAKR